MRLLVVPAALAMVVLPLPLLAAVAQAETVLFYVGPQPTAAGSLFMFWDAMNNGNGWEAFTLNCAGDQSQLLRTEPAADLEGEITLAAQTYRTSITVTGQPDGATEDITVEQVRRDGGPGSSLTALSLVKQQGTWCVAGQGALAGDSTDPGGSHGGDGTADRFGQQ